MLYLHDLRDVWCCSICCMRLCKVSQRRSLGNGFLLLFSSLTDYSKYTARSPTFTHSFTHSYIILCTCSGFTILPKDKLTHGLEIETTDLSISGRPIQPPQCHSCPSFNGNFSKRCLWKPDNFSRWQDSVADQDKLLSQ